MNPYEEIRALRSRLARIEAAAGLVEAPRTYTTAELGGREFYKAHEQDIHAALREPGTPRIVEGQPETPVTVEYPAPLVPGLIVRGADTFEAIPPTPKKER
jgi:hypothetical protein